MSAWQVLTDFAILKEITCPSPTSGKEHTSIASSSAKTWQCGLVGGAITILKNISQWMSMGRIIPYIMENKKMFETTNQWYFGAVDGCGKMWMAMWTAAPRNTRSSRSDRSTSTIWSWWIEGANMCHMRALRKIQWPFLNVLSGYLRWASKKSAHVQHNSTCEYSALVLGSGKHYGGWFACANVKANKPTSHSSGNPKIHMWMTQGCRPKPFYIILIDTIVA